MVQLNFTLSPESTSKLHDALSCLSRFSDSVSLEAQREILTLSTLNSSRSAYASFKLHKRFFSDYEFEAETGSSDGRFTCSILNKALMPVFKRSVADSRNRDFAIDCCEVSLQDGPDQSECRLVVKMICNCGVIKTYKLTYESIEVMHALFDKGSASSEWTIKSGILREFTDFFSPKAEQLDIYCEDGKVTFLGFTDKVVNTKHEVLKQPLKTAVSVQLKDFEKFNAQEKMHLIISVKDFKSIIIHADTLKACVSAHYSTPGRPLQFDYSLEELQCQFTLMTAGDNHNTPVSSTTNKSLSRESSRPRPSADNDSPPNVRSAPTEMPPPVKTKARKLAGKLGQNESATGSMLSNRSDRDSESLFVQQEEVDRQWDPAEYDNEEESLGWNATIDNDVAPYPTLKDNSAPGTMTHAKADDDGLPPTQRISQIRGLW